ncbi:glycosyltransferase family 2 protein, partial [Kaistella sp.]|uniref:glycosyltransferase family 2 protein n=1 Tax=Kaistella sp. TaxID=2782235 RepID=UPI002F95CE3A
MNYYKVYCIIVTYNAMRWIDKCIDTIKEDHIELKIVVIDNNSTDGTVEYIKENFPDIQILPQNENLGF